MSTVVVIGANGGLGHIVTQTLLKEGHCVIATRQNGNNLQNLIDHLSNALFVYEVDLTDEMAVIAFVEQTISQYGPIDAAILLVGAYAGGTLLETGSNLLDRMIAINFKTAYNCKQTFFEVLFSVISSYLMNTSNLIIL